MTWLVDLVDSSPDVGMYPSLKIDSNGTLHVAYFDHSQFALKYAWRTQAGTWNLSKIADNVEFHDQISLALDPTSSPHVAYPDHSNFTLRYASPPSPQAVAGLPWPSSKIDTYVDRAYCSLAIASDGTRHVSYFEKTGHVNITGSALWYAKRSAGQWALEAVDPGFNGYFTSIALEANGVPHISYYDFGQKNLKYATRLGPNNWTTCTVDTLGDTGQGTSLAIGASGSRHIAYYDSSGHLKHAVNSSDVCTQWTTQAIDFSSDGLWNPSLALGGLDKPHISYYDVKTKALKYAKQGLVAVQGSPLSQWKIETVPSRGEAGLYSSIALDSYGHPHICYYTNGHLAHATRTP